jgi:chromodomain-helicase-DNA-binding protein 7
LQQIQWKALITDEAQRLKNTASKLINNLRQFKTEHRVLLTGTPLQNNTQELWTLLNFIEPQKFASLSEFMAQFGQLTDSEQVPPSWLSAFV